MNTNFEVFFIEEQKNKNYYYYYMLLIEIDFVLLGVTHTRIYKTHVQKYIKLIEYSRNIMECLF